MAFFDEPQWAVVGDTFPVGCQYAKSIVYRDFTFILNPDYDDKRFVTGDDVLYIYIYIFSTVGDNFPFSFTGIILTWEYTIAIVASRMCSCHGDMMNTCTWY